MRESSANTVIRRELELAPQYVDQLLAGETPRHDIELAVRPFHVELSRGRGGVRASGDPIAVDLAAEMLVRLAEAMRTRPLDAEVVRQTASACCMAR